MEKYQMKKAMLFLSINRSDIDVSSKKEYVEYLDTKLHNLSDFTDHSIWSSLLDSGELICSERNILSYLGEKQKVDFSLVKYINSADKPLDFSPQNIDITEEERDVLLDYIVSCNNIVDERYKDIMATIGLQYVNFGVSGIQDSKMAILIDNDIIQMNTATLTYVRAEYESSLFRFIRKHIKEYLDLINDELFIQEELVEILSWDVEDSYKMKLLSYSTDAISIIGKNYSLQICVYILKNNLQQDDMTSFYLSYNQQPNEIKEIVLQNATDHFEEIIDDPRIAEEPLKEDLLCAGKISFEDKVHLLAVMLQDINQAEALKCLSILKLTDFIQIFDSHSRPKFERTAQNQVLLDAFKRKKWIYEYYEDENHPDYYKIRRREPRKTEVEENRD